MKYSKGFSSSQIILHWLTVILVLFNLVFGDDMRETFQAAKKGTPVSLLTSWIGNFHAWFGIAVLLIMFLRLILRFSEGVPAPDRGEKKILVLVANATAYAFYAVLFYMPITGIGAYYLGLRGWGGWHEAAKPLLIALIALHATAALWHHFIKRDNVLKRMIRPE